MTRLKKKDRREGMSGSLGSHAKQKQKGCAGGMCAGVLKSNNIKRRKGNEGVEKPAPFPVPCAWRVDPGQVWGM